MPEMLEAEAARQVLEARALGRVVASVHVPDPWFLKRGTTPQAVRHALRGRLFVAARRRGKQLVLDADDGMRLGMHLGMSGRVVVDGEAAGDPLVYASNRADETWHRFGVRFADGGALYLRDPRRLGAVELDPDESRLGPDAGRVGRAEFVRVVGDRRAPVKAVLMDQSRVAGLGNLLVDETLWRAGIDPARPTADLSDEDLAGLWRAMRSTLRVLGRRGGSHTGDLPREPGAPCPRDGAPLRRTRIGGRTTFSCPVHQH